MKYKVFICGILIFWGTLGAIAPSQITDSSHVNTDSVLIDLAAKVYVDSLQNKQEMEIDSLSIVIDSIKQDRRKKIILGRTDKWKMVNGKIQVWYWWYWLFPNGERKFYGTTKRIE